jgi:HlyD family secretion protein
MKGKNLGIIAGILVVAGGGYAFMNRGGGSTDVEYRYEKLETGELVRSIQATGQLIPLTSVDIRSKAGGRVDKILVEEGTEVKMGQLLAMIDPSDTRSTVEQAQADVEASQARAELATVNLLLEVKNRRNAVREAENALEIARMRLERAQIGAKSQPELTQSELSQARSALASQEQALVQLQNVDFPRRRTETRNGLERAKSSLDSAVNDLKRQEDLFKNDYISKAQLDRAVSAEASAKADYENAQERVRTLEKELDVLLKQQKSRVSQAEASLRSALTNQSRDQVVVSELSEAKTQVQVAQLNLEQARNELQSIEAREAEQRSATASTVRSRVALENAQVQLDSTTVTSPRDGVVTKKYLEAGTIIPPGANAFSQGTAIVQISDTTIMYVECAVDEADIQDVKVNQEVRIIVEAYTGKRLKGVVTRINPAAETNQNITAIRVRVQVTKDPKVPLKPGMNATCEFLTLNKPNVLIAPQQAVKTEDGKTFVQIKTATGKPQKVEVTVGEEGNEGFEILSGLKAGDEVVVAEINLAEMRDIQKRMQEAQQGGGLAGGRPQGGGARPSGGGSGGGARSGGGGSR